MEIIKTIEELKKYRKTTEGKVGFVPTMGHLHDGHLSLMKAAREECNNVIVSIFVNPTQFGPNEDLDAYPRDFERDKRLCEGGSVDCIFYPDVDEMYPREELTIVRVERITQKLCGKTRPTHFQGVTTVVAKLFNIVQPDIAYFGQKDLQQSIVIKRMAEDLNMDIKIKVCPIVREKDGLAMSSRNSYLKENERKAAPVLYESLQKAKGLFEKGENNADKIKETIRNNIEDKVKKEIGNIDYIEIFDTENIDDVKKIKKGNAIALAVFIGKARLIDNIIL
ncbi:MAG: pantoate--beta-alanine ligase [Nanoarchaeota archaeon]|nr:pantoate--beta-alanine ligase [Nanoarchaeota archaeon]